DVDRRVQVGLVGGEGAVLAVALARPRQRKREVAGESNPLHPGKTTGRAGSAGRALFPTGGLAWRAPPGAALGFFRLGFVRPRVFRLGRGGAFATARLGRAGAFAAAGGGRGSDALRRLGRQRAAGLDHEAPDADGDERADQRADQEGPDATPVVGDERGAEP